MATAEQYAQWIVDNADKKGTPEFDTVARAYQETRGIPTSYTPPEEDEGWFIPEAVKGLASGASGMLSSAATGASFLLPEEAEQSARRGIASLDSRIQEALAPASNYEDSMTRKFTQALGSTAPFLASGFLGLPGLIAGVATGAAAGAGEAAQRAEAAGATEEQISEAAGKGIIPGLSETLAPFAIGKTIKAARLARGLEGSVGKDIARDILSRLRRIGMAAGGEGLQEASSEVMQNLIAQDIYDPDTGTFTGTGESLGYGAGVGGFIAALAELAMPRTRGGPRGDLFGNTEEPTQPLTPEYTGRSITAEEADVSQEDLDALDQPIEDRLVNQGRQESEDQVDMFDRVAQEDTQLPVPIEGQDAQDVTAMPVTPEGQAVAQAQTKEYAARQALIAEEEAAIAAEAEQFPDTLAVKLNGEPILDEDGEPILDEDGDRIYDPLEGTVYNPQRDLPPELVPTADDTRLTPPRSPTAIDGPMLEALGIPKAAAMYKRLTNKRVDFTDPAQRQEVVGELTKYANLRTTNSLVKENIDNFLNSVESPTFRNAAPQPAPQQPDMFDKAARETLAEQNQAIAEAAATQENPDAVAPIDREFPVGPEPTTAQLKNVGPASRPDLESLKKPQNVIALAKEAEAVELDVVDTSPIESLVGVNYAQKTAGEGTLTTVPEKASAYYFNTVEPKSALRWLAADLVTRTDAATRDRAATAQKWVQNNLSAAANNSLTAQMEEIETQENVATANTEDQKLEASMSDEDWQVELERRARLERETAEQEFKAQQAQERQAILDREEAAKKRDAVTDVEATQTAKKPNAKFNAFQESLNSTEENSDVVRTLTQAEQIRADIAMQTQAFLDNGGKITESLAADAVMASTEILSTRAEAALEEGKVGDALKTLSESKSTLIRRQARALANILRNNVKVVMVNSLPNKTGGQDAGQYDPATDTITLNLSVPLTAHTLLHESSHAATHNTLKKPSHPVTQQLKSIYNDIRQVLPNAYAAQSLEDFVAEAYVNTEFKSDMAAFTPTGKKLSAWKRFMNAMSQLFRLGPVFQTADSAVAKHINNILAVSSEERGVTDVWSKLNDGDGGLVISSMLGANGGVATKDVLSDAYTRLWENVKGMGHKGRMGVINGLSLQNIAEMVKKELPSAELLYRLILKTDGVRTEYLKMYNNQHTEMEAAFKGDPEGRSMFNRMASFSTTNGVDPTLEKIEAQTKYEALDGKGNPTEAYKEKMKAYDIARGMYVSLEQSQQQVFKDLVNAYKFINRRILDAMEKRLTKYLESEGLKGSASNQTVKDILARMENAIEPYLPLDRSGDYWIEYYMTYPGSDSVGEYVTEAYESEPQRKVAMKRLGRDIRVNNIRSRPLSEMQQARYDGRVPISFLDAVDREINKEHTFTTKDANGNTIQQTGKLDGSLRKFFKDTLLQNLPEQALLQGARERANIAGFRQDHLSVFKDKAPAMINSYANISNQVEMDRAAAAIRDEAKAYAKLNPDDEYIKDVSRALVAPRGEADGTDNTIGKLPSYYEFAKQPYLHKTARNFRAATFVWTLGANLSGAVVNAINPVLMGIPVLGGRYGLKKASLAMHKATSLLIGSGISYDADLVPQINADGSESARTGSRVNEGMAYTNRLGEMAGKKPISAKRQQENMVLKPFMDASRESGMDVRTIASENNDIDNPHNPMINRVLQLAGVMQNHSERFSRNTVGGASYLLYLQDKTGKTFEELTQEDIDTHGAAAAEQGIYDTEAVNSSAYVVTGARIGQNDYGSLVWMYKRFPAQMAYMQAKMATGMYKGWKGTMPAEEARAMRNSLIYLYGTSATLAGVSGVPLYGIVSQVWDLFLDDDEDDFDTIISKGMGELGFSGIVNAGLNLDISGRISMTNLMMRDRGNYEPDNKLWGAVEMAGGPTIGVATRIGRGMTQILDGEPQRGAEQLLPSGIGNALKAFRFATEGMQTYREDDILDEVHPWSVAAQMLGFTPADYAKQQEINALNRRIDRNITGARSDLVERYYTAWRNNDGEGREEVIQDIIEFNAEHPEVVIASDNIVNSIRQRAQNTWMAGRLNGVILTNKNRLNEVLASNAEFEKDSLGDE